ncbi:serine/arginine repetitive matrix protein 2 isoform X4 [Drosophila subpulchrella]|uniref:serine/arginine repetitive matrix protein 2 isoform X4 n=1 Tax=Drosophila subpulchrella TaxID=1486046 RepID=UPI0018A13FFB|nr:serine/arginine repetitive matrix protein 2 isoform X4 [Drosophila subpulchrella]
MSRLPRPTATNNARGSGGHGRHPVAGESHSQGQYGSENAKRCNEANPKAAGISGLHQGDQVQAPKFRRSSSSGNSDCELILAEKEEIMPRRRHIREDRKQNRSRSRGRSRGHSRGRSHGRSRSRSYTDTRRSRALPLALPVRISVGV